MSTSPEASISSEQLAVVPLVRGLSAEALARIRRMARPKAIDSGDRFFSEGEEAEGFFVRISGRVKLTQLTLEGHQIVLRIVGAGEAFCGAGAFGNATYPDRRRGCRTSRRPRVEFGRNASATRYGA